MNQGEKIAELEHKEVPITPEALEVAELTPEEALVDFESATTEAKDSISQGDQKAEEIITTYSEAESSDVEAVKSINAIVREGLDKAEIEASQEVLEITPEQNNKTEAPNFETYTAAALINLENTSRTAKGTVDVSASPDKAQKMQEGLTSESAADLAKSNFQEALHIAYENKDRNFENASELRQFIESFASKINQGITKEGVLIRQGADSPKYSYARVSELEGRMSQFYEELNERLKNPKEDSQALAAWVEYKIDLSDHFFADGCGKTAKLVSSWIMMRAGKKLPDYTIHGKIPREKVRDEYYANAPKTIPGENPEREAEELKSWTEYYKKL